MSNWVRILILDWLIWNIILGKLLGNFGHQKKNISMHSCKPSNINKSVSLQCKRVSFMIIPYFLQCKLEWNMVLSCLSSTCQTKNTRGNLLIKYQVPSFKEILKFFIVMKVTHQQSALQIAVFNCVNSLVF